MFLPIPLLFPPDLKMNTEGKTPHVQDDTQKLDSLTLTISVYLENNHNVSFFLSPIWSTAVS